MNPVLKVGIVGLGYWGPNLTRNFSSLPGSEVAALCDIDQERLRVISAKYPGVPTFNSVEEMLAAAEIDAVVVATPLRQHYAIVRAALFAGKHTLVEKPLASSVKECVELTKIAESRGLTLMVGHTFIYSSAIEAINDMILAGEIGEIRYINSQRLNLGIFQTDINVVWDLAPHDLSIILHLLRDSPRFVNCQGCAHLVPSIEDVANISLSFDRGQFATIQNSWLEPRKVRQMTIVGTKKMIVYDDIEPLEKIRVYDSRVDCPPHYDSFDQFHYAYHYGNSYIPRIIQTEPLKKMCQHFVDSVTHESRPISCGLRGTEVVRVLEACSKSLVTGGSRVSIPARAHFNELARPVERAAHTNH
jgi:predicted dehydrogenase